MMRLLCSISVICCRICGAEMKQVWADSERLQWLDDTKHVLCYNDGRWFCAWRGSDIEEDDGWNWVDRPGGTTPVEAIDLAKAEVDSEKEAL